MTLAHGSFGIRETVTVYVCASGCKKEGRLVTERPLNLAQLLSPKTVVGYDAMAHADYVQIVCGTRDRLADAFAQLDAGNRSCSIAAVTKHGNTSVETTSLSTRRSAPAIGTSFASRPRATVSSPPLRAFEPTRSLAADACVAGFRPLRVNNGNRQRLPVRQLALQHVVVAHMMGA